MTELSRSEFEEMTKDDLRSIAEERGIKLASLDSKGTIIDKILGVYDEPEPRKPDSASIKEPPLGALYTLQGEKFVGRKYRLTIFATETDKSDVDLIVNGHNLRIRRGEEVIVAEPYIELLRNAVIDTTMEDPDTGKRYPQRIMTYPHTAVPV